MPLGTPLDTPGSWGDRQYELRSHSCFTLQLKHSGSSQSCQLPFHLFDLLILNHRLFFSSLVPAFQACRCLFLTHEFHRLTKYDMAAIGCGSGKGSWWRNVDKISTSFVGHPRIPSRQHPSASGSMQALRHTRCWSSMALAICERHMRAS